MGLFYTTIFLIIVLIVLLFYYRAAFSFTIFHPHSIFDIMYFSFVIVLILLCSMIQNISTRLRRNPFMSRYDPPLFINKINRLNRINEHY